MNGPVLNLRVAETDREEFRQAVLDGLSVTPRAIPAKFLYDERGSALFDEICELPEYYLTRTETAILKRHAADIGRRAGPGCALIEFGSGSSVKSRLLIEALPELALYAPIDISREHLDTTAARLRRDYPRLNVLPVCADFMKPVLPIESGGRRLGFFPGSTVGNLTPSEATVFLRHTRELLGDDGALVLGVDLKKDPQRLHDAYNDAAGVTAAFTLNLLRRLNRELHATFDLAAFAHEAFYDEAEGRIEIYFRSLKKQSVMVAGQRFDFAAGERVHTEYSYKYDTADLSALAASGGFRVAETWTDPERLFAVVYLESIA
ncbi:MAG: L-histidine N(alpha)-methyltransferase [Reyranella sp.]|uniref:L-histidine N(alpha)-methyltransferase n=1 Tax=Reyranella sp. TaxID=1929291 RepID=UPI001AC4FFDB|nr:L-histidine N(alpha)-methyltransferase [Reyranella sp.]MBN9088949.1 L-histidine N(alpha)-methyltransferase [Reyranella sp.]